MLTHLATAIPPRVGHLLARLLGLTAAVQMFCLGACCETHSLWDDETEVAA